MSVISKPELDSYMPHRGQMQLISRLIQSHKEGAKAEVDVPQEGLFVMAEGVPAYLGIEYMAQTAALWGATVSSSEDGTPDARQGFLLGGRNVELHVDYFPSGTTLTIDVVCSASADSGLRQFSGWVKDGAGKVMVEGRLNVFVPSEKKTESDT